MDALKRVHRARRSCRATGHQHEIVNELPVRRFLLRASPIISPAEKDGDRRLRRLYRLGCGNDLYLDSRASYEVAQLVAGTVPLALNEQTLRHRLCAHGLLASVDLACQTLPVRRTLTGCPGTCSI